MFPIHSQFWQKFETENSLILGHVFIIMKIPQLVPVTSDAKLSTEVMVSLYLFLVSICSSYKHC